MRVFTHHFPSLRNSDAWGHASGHLFFLVTDTNQGEGDWIILTVYAVMTVATIFTILDLDRPSRGIITTKQWSDKIADLQKMLSEP